MPLYEKGDVNNPTRYKGISICGVGRKLYSCIINRKLQEWVEENITDKYQAVFKRAYFTIGLCLFC